MRLLALLLVTLVTIFACGGNGGSATPATPGELGDPRAWRPGVEFSYYLNDGYVGATADHVTMQWIASGDWESYVRDINAGRVLGTTRYCVGMGEAYVSEERLHQLFGFLRTRGVLSAVRCGYPQDEPQVHGLTEADVTRAHARIRQVAAQYPELDGLVIAVLHACDHEFLGAASTDWIGCDKYEAGTGVLAGAIWAKLKATGKGILLVPGGANPWQHGCDDYVTKALNDPQVVGVVAFLHAPRTEPSGFVMQGIGTNGMGARYAACAHRLRGW